MADLQKEIAAKVYRDEPISRTAAQMAELTPPQYREMRMIANTPGFYRESEARIFHEQGKFMEDFEDDCDCQGGFARYFPTYRAMNDRQLRGYFSWRTRLRRGTVEKTSLSYAFVYIYELLNRIGVRSAEEGFRALADFLAAYGALDDRITAYMRLWMRDYVVYNDLDKSLLANFADAHCDDAVLILLNPGAHDAGEVFGALNAMSSYNFTRSGFFKQYPDDVEEVVCAVFAALTEYYGKKRKNGIHEEFFGKMYANPYTMFKSAVYYDRAARQDFVYEINDIYKYRCRGGNWTCERFFGYKGKVRQIGALLKAVDHLMRRQYRFKSALKVDGLTKIYRDIIDGEIERYRERKRKRTRPEIEIDVAKLPAIRHAALATQEKLIVADAEEAADANAPQAPRDEADAAGLFEAERRFVRGLLRGEDCSAVAASLGVLPSILADAVNEKLFERFGDPSSSSTGRSRSWSGIISKN